MSSSPGHSPGSLWSSNGRGHSLACSPVMLDLDCEVLVVRLGAPFTTLLPQTVCQESGVHTLVLRGQCRGLS